MKLGNYIAIYVPDHKRSFKNGLVYEHIINAEKAIGRDLKDNEVVHHIDKNKYNNDLKNLMVFENSSYHAMYHSSNCDDSLLFIGKNGTFCCKSLEKNKCKICMVDIDRAANLCRVYHNNSRQKYKITREELKEMLKNNNFLQIAEHFGVSDNAIRKRCKLFNLPYRTTDIKKINKEEWKFI